MVTISAYINGHVTNTIVDTGAGVSVIDESLAKKVGKIQNDILPIDIKLIWKNRVSIDRYMTAKIVYENSQVELRFFIINDFPYPALLGIEWCKASKVKIDFGTENDYFTAEGWITPNTPK